MFGFASFAALRACVSRDWTPAIGDPEVTGWLTVLAVSPRTITAERA